MKKIKNIVLDLDNTLISAEPTEDFPFNNQKIVKKTNSFSDRWNMDDYYIVVERPHLQEFLDFLFKNYNVSVWTAATKDYALFIVKHILLKKPNRKLDWIMFSYHCDLSYDKFGPSKDLRMLWDEFGLKGFNSDNTLIIDDLNEVYDCQPDNCINIKAFEFLKENSEKDEELKKIKDILSVL